jgi:hypothetical protein
MFLSSASYADIGFAFFAPDGFLSLLADAVEPGMEKLGAGNAKARIFQVRFK